MIVCVILKTLIQLNPQIKIAVFIICKQNIQMNEHGTCEQQLVCLILDTILDVRCQNPYKVSVNDPILLTKTNSRTRLSILLQIVSNHDQSSTFALQSLSLSLGFNSIMKEGQVTENKVQIVKEVLKNCGRQALQIGKLVETGHINCYHIDYMLLQSEQILQWDHKSLYTVINPLFTLEIQLFGYSDTKDRVKQWIKNNQQCKVKQCGLVQKRQTATSLNYDLSKIFNFSDCNQIISQNSQTMHGLQEFKSIKYDMLLLVSEDSSVHELIPSKDMDQSHGQMSETVSLISKQSELFEEALSIRLFQSKQEQFHELKLCKDLKFYCENQELFKELTEMQKQYEQENKAKEAEVGLKGKFESRLAKKFKKLSQALKR